MDYEGSAVLVPLVIKLCRKYEDMSQSSGTTTVLGVLMTQYYNSLVPVVVRANSSYSGLLPVTRYSEYQALLCHTFTSYVHCAYLE